jgi:Cu(I)/Ag(I) efflux system membrane fusion protein
MTNSTRQIWIAGALVGAAVLVVVLLSRSDTGAADEAAMDMEGHDHAAMMAGLDEAQPVSLPPELIDRTGVTFAVASRRELTRRVVALGRVEYDETRLADVSPKLEGWAERLVVDFTGAPVEEGETLFEWYSPVVVAAQEELLLAASLVEAAEPGTDRHASAVRLLDSARRRLSYWDIPIDVVEHIEHMRHVMRTVPLRSPATGIVVEKAVVDGGRFMPGETVYRIADLSRIWVEADVFERDLSLVGLGQHAMITLEAYPGEMFHGEVTYVYPTLDPETRTGTVRVELDNPGLRLRPGMFASLDFPVPTAGPVLLVPRGAVLATGERTLVFVQSADGTLTPREVVTGLAAGQDVEILSGLSAGERVVSSASFLIDAESNLGSAAMLSGTGEGGADMEGMDHSQHQMAPAASPDTGMEGMDHSGHDMTPDTTDHSGHDMAPDTTDHSGHDMDTMDHSGHDMAPDTTDHSGHSMPARPDTTDHSGHSMPAKPDTTGAREPGSELD